MGLKGNLAVVNLADVFQMLSRGKSTGLLRVQAPEGTRYIELQDGVISLAGRSTQYMQLGDLLLTRKAIDYAKLETALKIHKENGMVLGQVLLEMNYVSRADLESALHFVIEEEICDLFTLREGDFDFLANATLDTKIAPGGGAIRLRIEPDSLLLEAARRADEWHEIEQRIPSQSLLFRLTPEGQNVYKDADSISEEGRVLMRLLQANNTVEGIVQKSCLGRLNANRMILELWDAQLIEQVPKDEYVRYAKLQMEAGQFADSLRLAVMASKAGSPDTIKAAIPLIDTLRKQLAVDAKQSGMHGGVKDKETKSPSVRKPAVQQNLIIKKAPLPWAKIGIITGIILALGGAGTWFVTRPDPHKEALTAFTRSKEQALGMIKNRQFLDAKNVAKNTTSEDADIKKDIDNLRKEIDTQIDTKMLEDIAEFEKSIETGLSEDDLTRIKKNLKDFDGWVPVNDRAVKALKKINKQIPVYESQVREAKFKSLLEQLQREAASHSRPEEEIIKSGRDILGNDPPESVAKLIRDFIYQLMSPRAETMRALSLAKELVAKGGFESARKSCETIRAKYAGTGFGSEAKAILDDIKNRQDHAQDALAHAHTLVLQKKEKESIDALEALLKSNPPRDVLTGALEERRKLGDEIPEAKLAERVAEAKRISETDPKKARLIVLDEVIATHPWSQAAWSATLRVLVASSPEGATVALNTGAADRVVGVTRDSQPLYVELPAMGPIKLTFTLPGFEPFELVENNLRSEKIEAVFVRKPQVAVLAPVAASAGMATLGDLLLLAGGNELSVCNRNTLAVLRRVNLEDKPLPITGAGGKPEQPPPLKKGELKLRALSVNSEDAYAFAACTGPYFFQIAPNGTDFWRIAALPGAVGAPQLFRPEKAQAIKTIALMANFGWELFTEGRRSQFKGAIPSERADDQPFGIAFDGDTFYVPRDNNIVYAIEGYRGETKFSKQCADRISVPPAISTDGKLMAIIDVKGRVVIVNVKNEGRETSRSDLEAPSSTGLAAASDGFLAATDDGALSLIPTTGGKPAWTVKLPAKALFTPTIFTPGKTSRVKAPVAIVCCEQVNNSYTLMAFQVQSGTLLWRARLPAKPIAAAVGPDAVYISTIENELLKFDILYTPQN